MNFSYEYQGQTHTLNLQRQANGQFLARLADREWLFSAQDLGEGRWLLQIGNEQVLVHSIHTEQIHEVHLNGQNYALSVVDSRSSNRKRTQAKGDLSAQMPALITDIRIAEGDSVASGQVLLVMEAMKMEIRVVAPMAGVVKRLLVQKGQTVERGQILVEMSES
jgi:biotin carboxyl carrier protein